ERSRIRGRHDAGNRRGSASPTGAAGPAGDWAGFELLPGVATCTAGRALRVDGDRRSAEEHDPRSISIERHRVKHARARTHVLARRPVLARPLPASAEAPPVAWR